MSLWKHYTFLNVWIHSVKKWHCTNVTLQLCVRSNLWMTVTAPNQTVCAHKSQRGCRKAVLSKIILSIPSVYYMTNLQCRVSERTPPPHFCLCIWLARSAAGIFCFNMWLTYVIRPRNLRVICETNNKTDFN